MSCVEPEVLSRWVDGTLPRAEGRAVQRHVVLCAACRAKADGLRAAAEWLVRATEPGPGCLSGEQIASVLEGAELPDHVRTCPRCASEIAALRPRKRASRRITVRRQETGTGWFAAAAAITVTVLALVFLAQQKAARDVARAPEPPPVELPREFPVRPSPSPETPRRVEPPAPAPDFVVPRPESVPAPTPERPEPAPGKPETKPEENPAPPSRPSDPVAPPRRTVAEAPIKKDLPLSVKSGAISAFADGKWTAATRIEEGLPLRAEGKTSIDFARARVTFDGSSRFTLGKDEVALTEGAISLDVQQGSGLSLVLGPCRVVPMASAGRVLLSAKPDRVAVDEGAARWQEIVLHQGVEHAVVKDKLEPQKRRTLPAAARPRETLTWRPDFRDQAVKSRIHGRIDALPEGTQVVSLPTADKNFFQSQAGFVAPDERGFFATKAATALRFRYFLSEAGLLQLVVYNGTKRENFNLDLDPAVRQWTTATIYFRDVPVNTGGNRAFKFDPGDRVWSIGWFVGKPGSSATLTVDSLEVVEIER